jgi:hypothetical protein
MPQYITQQLFNMCAVSVVKISSASGQSLAEVASQLAETYGGSYGDEDLAGEIALAADQIGVFIRRVLPSSSLVGNLTQLQFCIKHYQPNGKKWPSRLFGGTLFNKEREPRHDKVRQCAANIATYHLLVINGVIPLMPQGWKL